MEDTAYKAIAIVGVGAVLPDAVNAPAFWENIKNSRYSITEVSPDRWDPALYYDPDHSASDKTYSKIGGWVREFNWDPIKWRMAIPPRVVDAMDDGQKWAISCTREALQDYGFPERSVNLDRTAVILGNAMGGERHYLTSLRVYFPEYARELSGSASFASLPAAMRRDITRELHQRIERRLPPVTEDSMPGELANCIAGRVANVFNLHGPNYTVDAACASAMAAINSAVEGLIQRDFDLAISGGVDRNMGAPSFVKFCKIGALSATGTRPYAEGADGFVMGEGAAVFLLKRLADAEHDGDKIYAVLRGMGGSSDGKGKGITAPNPIGQKFAIERAWENAGLSPGTATLIEGHGTSTAVGDVVEAQSMVEVLSASNLPPGSVALGSVKSNIGHLKAGAGAAGFLKVTMALRDKLLPPSLNFNRPNPNIDFAHSPLYVNTGLRPWQVTGNTVRRAALSAFGFGGTNFHAVFEEYIPHRLTGNGRRSIAVGNIPAKDDAASIQSTASYKAPLRGALVIGGASESALAERLQSVHQAAVSGLAPSPAAPAESDLRAPERLVIDYTDAPSLADKSAKALGALAARQAGTWKALRAQGIFRGSGPAPKVAFLYTGQGSQYVNMLKPLRAAEPIVAETFAEADRVMTPLLGKPLSEFIFVDGTDPSAVAQVEEDLRQTAITQPAVLATDLALTRLLAAYGIQPDLTMGHSLGEYGALVASGALPFDDALQAVSARGRGMTEVAMADNGRMAAVFAPMDEIEKILKSVDGYVVIANINSNNQAVIGGASRAVEQAIEIFLNAGFNAVPLPVSHAFHTSIVAGASDPLRHALERLRIKPPRIPVVANVDGEFYPMHPGAVPEMLDILGRQVASPVQFVKGLRTLYDAGARVFVEVGPKKALQVFADEVLGKNGDIVSLFTNHPKLDDIAAFDQALCGLYAAGLGAGQVSVGAATPTLAAGQSLTPGPNPGSANLPIAITGASLGLPGTERIFDDSNVARILSGEQFIDVIPTRFRRAILDKHITRLVKNENGGASFETLTSPADVIKLAGRGGALDLEQEFGVSADRVAALDRVTRLALAAGLDALRDAGIPLVLRYKTTSKGTQLQDRWGLPDAMRDDTGVVFASVWPGADAFAGEMARYYADHGRREQLALLESLRARVTEQNGHSTLAQELDGRMDDLRAAIERDPFVFDRRYLFRVLSMGHSQFAEFIGARGPNTQLNSACASTTQAVSLAEDWIRAGRCRRVIILSADDITSDNLIEWMGAGFLASGAAATDEIVEEAATPFDRRRHGMIIGMGAASLVVESAEAARERGIRPICEVLSAVTANSAFHGTRLDLQHISQLMEKLVREAESRSGVPRQQLAQKMVFVSHETYTPARGGSASAEIHALRQVFGDAADRIVIANTKGFTGHAMGAGIEDVVAVKALETGLVPPVANFKEVDPELGPLNLSKGGFHPVEYALRLGAGFGSQISMTLYRWTGSSEGARPRPNALGYQYRIADPAAWNTWLTQVAGQPVADLEVVHRTLRIRAGAPASVVPAPIQNYEREEVVAPPSPTPAEAVDSVKQRILALVAGKTGYPADMLALDLDLEADLGVDTVKQAEVFAAVREIYNIPREENLRLRDFPTLAHVIQFVRDRRPELAVQAPAPKAAENPAVQAALPPLAKPAPAAADAVKGRILALVVEKTGYPAEMLDPDLDLEADLGVDTVKQAELFAAVREAYNIPRVENLRLRDFPTLAHVVQFVYDHRPDLAAPAAAEVAAEKPARPDAEDAVKERILALVVEKTGYPAEMLDPDLDLEADLGVDTVKQAELFAAVREAYNIPRVENLRLRDFPTLAHVVQFVYDHRPDLAVPASAPPPRPSAIPVPLPDDIQSKVLDIVAATTGYPKEMLDLDLDLEADLGIDTVKQAEMFAAVRAAFNITRDAELKLRDFPTLAHVIQFARDRRSGPAEPSTVEPAPARPVAAGFDAANAIPRRVPVPNLRPALALCKATAVRLAPGSRVVLMPDQGGTGDALAEQLKSKGVEVLRIDGAPDEVALANLIQNWLSGGPVQGVYWLPALDDEGSLGEMELQTWREALRVRIKSLYTTMRALFAQIARPDTFLISATRLGGQHGYGKTGATAPMGGAVTGFTKTFKWERIDALVKAVDFDLERQPAEIAELLVGETLRDPGAVEIGYKDGLRWTVGLQEQPAADGRPGLTLDKETVFVITGAAGSIVSAITADLAAASGGVFYLLDVAPEPDPNNPDLKRFVTDKDGLKRDLFSRLQARGERATPAVIEKEMAALERAHAAQTAIDAVHRSGGTAHYLRVDLADPVGVSAAMDSVRQRSGRIGVLLHAAGIERSHYLPDKDPREFNLVFDIKSDGWFNLLHAIGDMPLGATVAFSSIAGRFGNGGQTDYSAANDLLCKTTSSFRTTRPGTRGIVIDWTAWGGIGMATRGSIPKMMEMAGIDMLPPQAGVPFIRRELTCGGRGEIVVAQRLGILLHEWDATGGLDTVAATACPEGPMTGKIAGMGLQNGLTVETTLDPSVQPFLYDHQIDGTPVLPGVMGIEAFAEAALCMLPGWQIEAVEDVAFLAPFKFYRNEPRTLTVSAVIQPLGDCLLATCRLTGIRLLPNHPEPQETTHFTARVRLAKEQGQPVTAALPDAPSGSVMDSAGIYNVYFHGPAYQVLKRAWRDRGRMVGEMPRDLPVHHHPVDRPLAMSPRLIELCFQTAGLWEMSRQGRMGLPERVREVRCLRRPDLAEGPLFAIVTPDSDGVTFDAEVVDSKGLLYVRLSGYRTVALEGGVDIESLKVLQAAV